MDGLGVIAAFGASVLSILALALLALLLSSYVRIVTVLAILRTGFGIYSLPSALVTSGLALVLSFFVMYPTLSASLGAMDTVLRQGQVTDQTRAAALAAGLERWKEFLAAHAQDGEKQRFAELAAKRGDAPAAELLGSWRVLAPAFLLSELKAAFATGLSLFLPFLAIDLLVIIAMTGLGLERLDPLLVSFPFKLLLFVSVDGWTLISANLAASYT